MAPPTSKRSSRGAPIRRHPNGMSVETFPVSRDEIPGQWPRYEVSAPSGFVFSDHGTHSLVAFTAKERDSYLRSRVERCQDPECDYCEEGA